MINTPEWGILRASVFPSFDLKKFAAQAHAECRDLRQELHGRLSPAHVCRDALAKPDAGFRDGATLHVTDGASALRAGADSSVASSIAPSSVAARVSCPKIQ